ncbi:MAG: maltose alpha-D-glucosyltransferase [Dehalococcoidia bacterium]|nr:maltose alpha-D-glucosyltransferase [Dehalococcoidia bacterium]
MLGAAMGACINSEQQWYKDAIIYEVHLRGFFDSNDDGIGELRGLVKKLDYIEDLGVNCIWLLPIYKSPLKDDGYDISDYFSILPEYGTLEDFRDLVDQAHRRGIRVITELVMNHTSDQHPWFQEARSSPDSPKRDYYIWSDTPDKYKDARIIFTDTEHSNWAWDNEAKAYYWHRFFSSQPDLNYDNPEVRQAIMGVMDYWFDMGVDGMRLDAAPYLFEREGTNCENLPEVHEYLKQIRRHVDERYGDRMLLAEANQWPADVRPYFGDGDECHMAFNFPVMPRIFMSLRCEDRSPIVDMMAETLGIPDSCQWAIFLRNHDELTLEMVSDNEREYMCREFARDPMMLLNVGIRRRLAPLMQNGRRQIELLNSLLLSLPGAPFLYYGDEIGMGDNIYLSDRNGVRTPMQWNVDRNGGFSKADTASLYCPPVMDPVYGYQAVNVEAQSRTPTSLLQWTKRIIAIRKRYPVFGRGSLEFLEPANGSILAFLREYEGQKLLVACNLSRFAQPSQLDLRELAGSTPVELFGEVRFPPIGELPYFLTLGPHGFYWFRLDPPGS